MVVTCAISLGCTYREVYHRKSGTSFNCRAVAPLTVAWSFVILGKRSAAASGTGTWGFGFAAAGLIAEPITIYIYYIYIWKIQMTLVLI